MQLCHQVLLQQFIYLYYHRFKKNDVVIMPAINFIAAFSMCKMMGKIHLADVDQ